MDVVPLALVELLVRVKGGAALLDAGLRHVQQDRAQPPGASLSPPLEPDALELGGGEGLGRFGPLEELRADDLLDQAGRRVEGRRVAEYQEPDGTLRNDLLMWIGV